LIVLDQTACPIGVVARHQRFYARESCGWCTPCRDGLPWVARILDALEDGTAVAADLEVLRMTAAQAGPRGRTFCDLMGGAMGSLASALERFDSLFDQHVAGGCPHREARR
jgi:NADH-quinone oxidoreductase subunit F